MFVFAFSREFIHKFRSCCFKKCKSSALWLSGIIQITSFCFHDGCWYCFQVNWRGIPTRLNNIPHSREIREYFYNDIKNATKRAIEDKKTRLKVVYLIPADLYIYQHNIFFF